MKRRVSTISVISSCNEYDHIRVRGRVKGIVSERVNRV